MNMIQRRFRLAEQPGTEAEVNGERLVCDPTGALYVPAHRLLVVSDLHLEKGAAFARRGMMLPPYDTASTLALLAGVIARYEPSHVVSLGDSFHDTHGAAYMPAPFRQQLLALMSGRDWTWITGNHDPEPPASVGGRTLGVAHVAGLHFRHEPAVAAGAGEIAGHLHPVAKVASRGRTVRSACFATDGRRMIMPSFGVTTGGMNVLGHAFAGMFAAERGRAYVVGLSGIFPISFSALCR